MGIYFSRHLGLILERWPTATRPTRRALSRVCPWTNVKELSLVRPALALLLLSLFIDAPNCFAGGFMVPHQTARGVGISNALTASVNDASAVYYNPAALSQVDGNNILVSGSYINVVSSVENDGRKAVNKY